jgi:hypothetical protein
MMLDLRLDYIDEIDSIARELMIDIREKYIALDRSVADFEDAYPNIANGFDPVAARAVSIARTHLETSLQYAIKALCLCGEIK